MKASIEWVDLTDRINHMNSSKALKDRTIGLEDEIIAVFGTAETLADRAVVHV
ncbi:hypothetical protein D3C76_1705080 [compost metagenome]